MESNDPGLLIVLLTVYGTLFVIFPLIEFVYNWFKELFTALVNKRKTHEKRDEHHEQKMNSLSKDQLILSRIENLESALKEKDVQMRKLKMKINKSHINIITN